jgi:hypothetical protein
VDLQHIARWLPRLRRYALNFAIVGAVAGAGGWAAARLNPGPKQPIPFSHRLHAGQKNISCLFCHTEADHAAYPGMPAVEKCLLCHDQIIPDFPALQPLHEARAKGEGVPWNRVNLVPDFVYFSHQVHVSVRGFDCGTCHGDVMQMDRVKEARKFTMGFCVDCHKQNAGPTDCWTCHR